MSRWVRQMGFSDGQLELFYWISSLFETAGQRSFGMTFFEKNE